MNKPIKCNDLNYKVYVEDTDFQGFVYHANYIKYFERSRTEFLSDHGILQKELIKENNAFVIKGIRICLLYTSDAADE